MFLFVGLGNPEKRHITNRHNIGFMAVDYIMGKHQFPPYRNRFQGFISEGKIGRNTVRILKPTTYMNESGRSVKEAVKFFKLKNDKVFVFYDDLDLIPGKCRIKYRGGSGGHNGLRSISAHIGVDYWRVRLGIGHPGHKDKVLRYVLQDFTKKEQSSWMPNLLNTLADNAELLLQNKENTLMSKLAVSVFSEKENKPD
ncbi:MAG: aminoacyl-tRNA hydrolase [Rhodospirillaceae bacterium]|nr:aminoacyl-tRNA hydrolase [Rhodospirillaceae bacterium]MBT5912438.1 aminoacyl-tRNA hydrolase [Rhodospirillaceae bacterium]MDC1441135.1 aminoacyl-tRNA hydrolase [Rhodospirillaceae bacterium]